MINPRRRRAGLALVAAMFAFLAGSNMFEQISDASYAASSAQETADVATSRAESQAAELLDLTDRIERLEARPYGYRYPDH